jgi:hypothetical protein
MVRNLSKVSDNEQKEPFPHRRCCLVFLLRECYTASFIPQALNLHRNKIGASRIGSQTEVVAATEGGCVLQCESLKRRNGTMNQLEMANAEVPSSTEISPASITVVEPVSLPKNAPTIPEKSSRFKFL